MTAAHLTAASDFVCGRCGDGASHGRADSDCVFQPTLVLPALLDQVYEHATMPDLVRYAQQEGRYCCPSGCGGGACEVCPCCCAGWCVLGTDGVPEDPADRERWLAVAAEHNPVAAALAGAR